MPVECVGVVGAGVMGSEIAQVAAAGGLDVLLSDVDQERVDRGVAHVRDICARRVKRGRMSQEDADALVARVHPVVGLEGLAPADLAIEAGTEVMEVKRKVFSTLDGVLGPDALIASNTSGLSITELGEVTSRPAQVLGLHFFNPASVMRLVEVIRGEHTGEATLAAGRDLAVSLGKTPVLVRECPGFLVNRILVRAMVESYRRAAETGAGAAAADAAVVAGGPAPMGPFALGDLIGLDTMDHIQGDLERAYGDRFADGGVLAGLGALFFLRAIGQIVSAPAGPELAVLVADLLTTPFWVAGGILLWRRQALGYAAGLGLLFQGSMLFVALLVFFILQPFVTGAPFPLTDFMVIAVMGLVCFAPFGLFVRGVLKSST